MIIDVESIRRTDIYNRVFDLQVTPSKSNIVKRYIKYLQRYKAKLHKKVTLKSYIEKLHANRYRKHYKNRYGRLINF